MTRTLEQDQASIDRNERIPAPPYMPSNSVVMERYRELMSSLPEKYWHLNALWSIALQAAETEYLIHRMQEELSTQTVMTWEGKVNPLIAAITSQRAMLASLYVKLRAVPATDVSSAVKLTKDENEAASVQEMRKDAPEMFSLLASGGNNVN